jgi:DNA-3-methyladenine glycosylase II
MARERDQMTSMPEAVAESIDSHAVLEQHLLALVAADPRFAPVLARAGEVPLRREPGGFAGMARIVNAQMLSVASAAAIHARFLALMDTPNAETLATVSDTDLLEAGLSRAKVKTLRHLAAAEIEGRLDYDALAARPAAEAIAALMALPGIGRWSAEIYLLFCCGHPDILPAGDLALRKAAETALGLAATPSEKQLRTIAETWSPWRGAAARLLWRHYARTRSREGVLG